MTVENDDELEHLRTIGRICRDVLAAMLAAVRPGITPLELDAIGARMLAECGAVSAPRSIYGFPGHSCISVGDAVAHGVPDGTPLEDGQLINIDVSAHRDGYFADTGASRAVGTPSPEAARLLDATRKAQYQAMLAARAGKRLRVVADTVEARARRAGFQVIGSLCGHGVGRSIHEPPTVANTRAVAEPGRFAPGQVVTVEPFLATRSRDVYEDDDGWTLRLASGGLGAQFEHSFVVTRGAPIILTA